MSSDSTTNILVQEGHVGLVLLEGDDDEVFYLEIPVDRINANSLDARRYLLFVGWCVLGVEGTLTLKSGEECDPDDDIVEGVIYYYVRHEDDKLCAIDLEVIVLRSTSPSESTDTREEFHTRLLKRDVCCVWSGIEDEFGDDFHIIPFRRGSEWLQLIVENRPHYDEDVRNLDNINDIRNGIFANTILHRGLDSREAVVLKTPNRYLATDDIPSTDRPLPDQVSRPRNARYTLQRLISKEGIERLFPNNLDAAFKKHTKQAKPSDLLLHYNYGAAAVRWWGRNTEVLEDHVEHPRPPASLRAKRGKGDVMTTRKKARKLAEAGRGGKRSTAGQSGTVRATKARRGAAPVMHESSGSGEAAKQRKWDEDDVMMFFWGNSRAAKERHRKKTEEKAQRMGRWMKGLSYV